MTNEERIAEFLCLKTEGRTSEYWYELLDRAVWLDKARSLLIFQRDELGFVQKDEHQIPPLIEHYSGSWQAIANGAYHKAGFVRVKSIVEGK
jgi:hypothetical protein